MVDEYLDRVKRYIPNSIKDLHIFLCYDDRAKKSYKQQNPKYVEKLQNNGYNIFEKLE